MSGLFLMDNNQKVLDSFVRNPTTYIIDVRNGSMLPSIPVEGQRPVWKRPKMRKPKEVSMTIKPPTMHVLALCASLLSEIPDSIIDSKEANLKQAMEYRNQMVNVLNVLSYETTEYPKYMDEFLLKNLSIADLLKIMQETALKCSPGFFLTSIQAAKAGNPMMMTETKGSTPTSS